MRKTKKPSTRSDCRRPHFTSKMLELEAEEMEQTKLKEYLLGLKEKLLAAKKKKAAGMPDHLMYSKRLHHFADQFLRSQGKKIPIVSLLADKAAVDEFITSSNTDFRARYSKLWAFLLHEEKRVSMVKRT